MSSLSGALNNAKPARMVSFQNLAQVTAVICLLCFGTSYGYSNTPTTQFAEANKLYDQGRFADAAAAYEQILKAGYHSAPLFFNLGNARFKSGEIGLALAAYRYAERSSPRDPDIRANLQFARNQVQGPTATRTFAQRWVSRLSLNEWTLVAASAVWLCLVLAATAQIRPALKKPLKPYLASSGLLAILCCLCLGVAIQQLRGNRVAFVIVKDATVRQGPLDEAQSAFVLHDGAEVRVLDQKDEWLQVSTDPRRIGWIKQTQVQELPKNLS